MDFESKLKGINDSKSRTAIMLATLAGSYFFLLNILHQKGILNDDDLNRISDNMEENFNNSVNTLMDMYKEAKSEFEKGIGSFFGMSEDKINEMFTMLIIIN